MRTLPLVVWLVLASCSFRGFGNDGTILGSGPDRHVDLCTCKQPVVLVGQTMLNFNFPPELVKFRCCCHKLGGFLYNFVKQLAR
jgi:hypothetical protein